MTLFQNSVFRNYLETINKTTTPLKYRSHKQYLLSKIKNIKTFKSYGLTKGEIVVLEG